MNTRTQLANAALGYLGEMQISDIDDQDSRPARVCKQFMQDTIDEILRSHRWSCALALATLTADATPPDWGYTTAYVLPTDLLQLLEINGQEPGMSQQYFDIQQGRLLSSWEECHIRYVQRIDVPRFDPLLAKAVALQLAAKIAIPLSLNMANQQSCVQQFMLALSEARRVNAIEKSTNANRQWGRVYGSSRLLACRNNGNNELYRYGLYMVPRGPI